MIDATTPADRRVHLYHTPGACSRVILHALEEIGEPYGETCIALAHGQQRTLEYLAINPKGKVPVLSDGGTILTESPAILYHLALMHPGARLLPTGADGRPTIEALADMVWIAGALHVTVARFFRPDATSVSDRDGVRDRAMAQLHDHAMMLERRYATTDWYYGDRWSIVDYYVTWVYALAANYGFPLETHPRLAALRTRCEARPAFKRTRALELAVVEREQMPMPPGFRL